MTTDAADVNAWSQPSMFSGDVYQITLNIGLMPLQNHYQIQMETVDPTTGTTLALWSRPHFDLDHLRTEFESAVARVLREIDERTNPF